MRVIADTSVFLAVALEEPEKERIVRLTKGYDLVAPDVLPFEIGNALSAMLKRRALNEEEAMDVWDVATTVPVALQKVDIRIALGIALRQQIYAYDAYFIECALKIQVPLLTLDHGLAQVARELGVTILE